MTLSRDDFVTLDRDLAELSARVAERVRQLKSSGRFPDTFDGPMNEMRARQRALRDRVAEAIRSGGEWHIAKAELTRDYRALFDNLLALEHRIDEEYSENNG